MFVNLSAFSALRRELIFYFTPRRRERREQNTKKISFQTIEFIEFN